MKVKNNTENLIPRKLIGGLVPKYATGLDIKWIGTRGLTYNSKDNPGEYRVIDGRVLKKRFYGWTDIGPAVIQPTNTQFKVDTPEVRAERERLYNKRMNDRKSVNNSTLENLGTQGNSSRGDIRGNGIKGNTRTTAKPAATTFTESPTNITDQSWLDARNAAMQRGWGTYNYNGLTYKFAGDELKLAANNWRNKRKTGYQAEGILDLNPPAEITAMIPRGDGEVKPEDAIVEKNTPIDTKTTPYTFLYQRQLTNNPNLIRDMLWLATQDVRNGKRDASYYGESSDLVSQLANANQNSAKNYIYNLWNTNNDIATQAGRKNYTESQGLTFGEPTTTFNWLNDVQEFLNKNKHFSKVK